MKAAHVALVSACLMLAAPAPAEAIQFANSTTTGKSVLFVPTRVGGQLFGPVGYSLGVRFAPGVADILGPLSLSPGFSELYSVLGDVDFSLRYRYPIADVQFLGRFNPAVSPFLGYRGIGTLTGTAGASLAGVGATGGFSNVHGLHYGVAADTELPLGLTGYAHAGMTTLMGGGWDQRHNGLTVTQAGSLDPRGMTLPLFGFGAAWQLGPVFRLAVGWDIFALPTHLRQQTAVLAPGTTWINGFNVGVTLLGLSF